MIQAETTPLEQLLGPVTDERKDQDQLRDQLVTASATIETYREAMAEAISLLDTCKETTAQPTTDRVIAMLDAMLGSEGKAHLLALRQHEALVNGLLAYRSNVIETLLPDICPSCGMPNREHAARCRYGIALTLIPEGMPPIEESATFRLGCNANLMRTWIQGLGKAQGALVESGHGQITEIEDIVKSMQGALAEM